MFPSTATDTMSMIERLHSLMNYGILFYLFSERGKARGKAVVEELNDKTMMSQVSFSDAAVMPECHELPEVFVDK